MSACVLQSLPFGGGGSTSLQIRGHRLGDRNRAFHVQMSHAWQHIASGEESPYAQAHQRRWSGGRKVEGQLLAQHCE